METAIPPRNEEMVKVMILVQNRNLEFPLERLSWSDSKLTLVPLLELYSLKAPCDDVDDRRLCENASPQTPVVRLIVSGSSSHSLSHSISV